LVLVALARRLAPSWLRVQVVLTNDAQLRRLNREFRDLDRATDVLAFLYESTLDTRASTPDAPADEPHAELYISLQRARLQARRHGHALRSELLLLALHGMLHLQGHDHERPAEARRMRAAEHSHLHWLARQLGGSHLEPLVPDTGTA
jgi:probable rRNA maturation factor